MKLWVICAVLLGSASARTAPAIDFDAAVKLLYSTARPPQACVEIECLVAARYVADPRAQALAVALYRETGSIVGLGVDQIVDGGPRGKARLVPQLPVGEHVQHLIWLTGAMESIESFFTDLFAQRSAPHYRWRGLAFRFVRSLDSHAPSAYTLGWSITYNVAGPMLTSADRVRETVFHELFHSNDESHGDWSSRTLGADYAAIIERCGAEADCLAPYAPDAPVHGRYYAFQPGGNHPAREYAAELAVRYFQEQTEMLRHNKLSGPAFKCGPAVNGRAWTAMVNEFFGGRDLVPQCGR